MNDKQLEYINEETEFLLNSDFDSAVDVDDIEFYTTCAERCYQAFNVQLKRTSPTWESLTPEEQTAWAYVVVAAESLI